MSSGWKHENEGDIWEVMLSGTLLEEKVEFDVSLSKQSLSRVSRGVVLSVLDWRLRGRCFRASLLPLWEIQAVVDLMIKCQSFSYLIYVLVWEETGQYCRSLGFYILIP